MSKQKAGTTLSALCERCDKQCSYTVDDMESSKFIVHRKCGWETSDVWCPECGSGGAYVKAVGERPQAWRCPDCGKEYKLPAGFYENPLYMQLDSELRAKGGAKPSKWRGWIRPENGVALLFVAIVVIFVVFKIGYICSSVTGTDGFYLELVHQFMYVLFFSGGCLFFGLGSIVAFKKKSMSKIMLLVALLSGCLFIFLSYRSAMDLARYVSDISLLNAKTASAVSGQVDRIYHPRRIGANTLYLKNQQYFNLGRYPTGNISANDNVQVIYLPASRHVLAIIKR